MMYMIALQEMTKCPFRVVDEINQVNIDYLIFLTKNHAILESYFFQKN